MADRRRFKTSRSDGLQRLSATLRHEAQAERPRFSVSLHDRVLAAIAAGTRNSGAGKARRAAAVVGGCLAVAAACVALAVATVRTGPMSPSSAPASTVAGQGIEGLPTPEEIGASMFSEVAALGAAAIGVSDLPDFAAFDPAMVATVDHTRP